MKAYLHSKRGRNTPHDFDDGYGIDCIIMISLFPCNVCNRLTLENIGYVGTSSYQMIGNILDGKLAGTIYSYPQQIICLTNVASSWPYVA